MPLGFPRQGAERHYIFPAPTPGATLSRAVIYPNFPHAMLKALRFFLFPLLAICLTLPAVAQSWALPKIAVTSLRSQGRHSAEQVSQVVMGTPLKVLSADGDWWKVRTPEGYEGFVRSNTLQGLSDSDMAHWRHSQRVAVCTDRTVYLLASPSKDADRVTDLVSGSILTVLPDDKQGDNFLRVALPDGREGYLRLKLAMPLEKWASQTFDPAKMPVYAQRFMGAPYVWGGTSLKGMDCSGLVQICAYNQGIMMPRDASQQVAVGQKIDKSNPSEFLAGDLLFFGNTKTGKITHVAISMGGPTYIHSSARVRISSLDPASPLYENPGLIAVRRIDPSTAASLSLSAHRFYF